MNNFAISSTGIGDALARSASALAGANNTLEESIGLITAANAVVQNPDSVGTAMKTLTMYLRAAKTELEEAGESSEGCADSVSKLRSQLMSLTGVDIMLDEHTFKSTYQIIKEISEVWTNLSDATRANVTSLIAGKRNANVVQALMTNFGDAEAAMQTAANSAGSAFMENEKYLDSIAGKLDLLKASFQDFSNGLIGSDFVKFFVDAATWIVDILNNLNKVHMLLPLIGATVAGIIGHGLAKDVTKIVSQVLMLSKGGADVTEVMKQISLSAATLSASQKKLLIDQINLAVSNGTLSQAYAEQITSAVGLTAANTGLTASNTGLAASFKALNAAIPIWGKIAAAIGGVIYLIAQWERAQEEARQEAIESSNEIIKSHEDSQKAYTDNISKINGLRERFSELSKGVSDQGKNVGLTASEYQEYQNILQQLIDISPGIVTSYDEQGEAVVRYKNALTDALAEQEKFNAAQMEEYLGSGDNIYKGLTESYKDAQKSLDDAFEDLNESIGKHFEESFKSVAMGIDKKDAFALHGIFEDMGLKDIFVDDVGNVNLETDAKEWENTLTQLYERRSEFLARARQAGVENIAELEGAMSSLTGYYSQLNSIETKQVDFLMDYLHYQDGYSGLYNQLPTGALDEFRDGLIAVNDPLKTGSENINAAGEYLKLYAEIINTKSSRAMTGFAERLRDGNISIEEYNQELENLEAVLKAVFGGTELGDIVVAQVVQHFASLSDGAKTAGDALEDDVKTVSKLSDAISELEKGYDLLDKARSEMSTDGGLSAGTVKSIQDMLTEGEKLSDYITVENGLLKLNVDAWESRTRAMMDDSMAAMEAELAELNAQNSRLAVAGSAATDEIIQKNSQRIAELTENLRIYRATADEASKTEDPLNLEAMFSSLDTVQSKGSELMKAMQEIRSGTLQTGEAWTSLISKYPELMAVDGILDVNTLSGQMSVLQPVMEGIDAQYDKIIDDKIEAIQAAKEEGKVNAEAADATIENLKALKELSIEQLLGSGETAKIVLDLEVETAGVDSVMNAIKSSNSELGMNNAEIEELTNRYKELDGFAPYKLFEKAATGIRLNTDELNELEAAYEAQQKLKMDEELEKLTAEYEELTQKIRDADDATNLAELYRERAGILSKIDALKTEQQQYAALTSAYYKWKKAQSGGEASDMYDDVVGSLENMNKLWKQGDIGTKEFLAAAQMLSNVDLSNLTPYEVAEMWPELYKNAQKYLTETDKGLENVLKTLSETDNELTGAKMATQDENGWWTIQIDDLNAAAEALGISASMMDAILGKLETKGFTIDYENPLDDELSKSDQAIREIYSRVQELNDSFERGEIGESEYLARLNELNGSAQTLSDVVEGTDLDFESMSIADVIAKVSELQTTITTLETNGIKVPVELTNMYTQANQFLTDLQTAEGAEHPVTANVGTTGTGQQELDQFSDDLNDLNTNGKADVVLTANDDDAKQKIGGTETDLEELDKDVADPDITANAEDADNKTEAINGILDKLRVDVVKPTVGLIDAATEAINGIKDKIGELPETKTITVKTEYEEVPVTGEEPGYVDNTWVDDGGHVHGYSGVPPYPSRPEYKGKDADIVPVAQEWQEDASAVSEIVESAQETYDNMMANIGEMQDFAMSSKDAAATVMQDFFGEGGFVDLLNRPEIPASMLADVGYEIPLEALDDLATVFSHGYTIGENGEIGIVLTPILPDGDPLEAGTLEDVVSNLVVGPDGQLSLPEVPGGWGFDLSDILISQMDLSGIPKELRGSYLDALGEALHLVQQYYYGNPEQIEVPTEITPEIEETPNNFDGWVQQWEEEHSPATVETPLEVIPEPEAAPVSFDEVVEQWAKEGAQASTVEVPITFTNMTISDAGAGVQSLLYAASGISGAQDAVDRLIQSYKKLSEQMVVVQNADEAGVGNAITDLRAAATEFTSAFADLGSQVDVGSIEIDADTQKALATIAAMSIPEADVVFNPDTKAVDAYIPADKEGTVHYKADFLKVITATVPKLQGVIEYQRQIVGSPAGATGTGFATGTAYRKGMGRVKGNGEALGGELGTELVVRDGMYFTIGDNGAEFFRYKDGDIIFNASQTEELLKTGRVRKSGGRGRVIGDGSAYVEGTAFADSFKKNPLQDLIDADKKAGVKATGKLPGRKPTKKKSGKKTSSKNDKDSGDNVFDWIEIAIARIEREITNLEKVASSSFKTIATRLAASADEIDRINKELAIQQSGYERYMKQADSVKLKDNLKEKVRDGTIDITKYDDKTQEKIQEYQQWYEKALACSDAIQDLGESLANLYQSRFTTIEKEFDNQMSGIEHKLAMFDERLSMSEYSGAAKPFTDMIKSQTDVINLERNKLAELKKAMDDAVNSGQIEKGSEAWYDMQKAIDSVTESVAKTEVEISKLYKDGFDAIAEEFSDKMGLIESVLSQLNNTISATEYTGGIKAFGEVITTSLEGMEILNNELDELEASLANALDSGAIKEGSAAWYDMMSQINSVKEEIQTTQMDISKVFVDSFEDIRHQFENAMSYGEHAMDYLDKVSAASEFTGQTKGFAQMVDIYRGEMRVLEDEAAALQKSMQVALDSGLIKEGSDAWYEMQSQIDEVNMKIMDTATAISRVFKEAFDEIENRFATIQKMSDQLLKVYGNMNSIAEYAGGSQQFANEIAARRKDLMRLEEELNTQERALKEAVDSGAIREGSDAWFDMRDAITSTKLEIQETGVEIAKLYKDSFDAVEDRFEKVTSLIDHGLKQLQNSVSATTYNGDIKPYVDLIDLQRENVKALTAELSRMQQAMDNAVDSGEIKEGSDAWLDMYESIQSVVESIQEAGIEISSLYEEIFNDVEKQYSQSISLMDSVTNYLKTGLDEIEARGRLGGAELYAEMSDIQRKNIAVQEKELKGLEAAMAAAIQSGEIAEGSEAWYNMQNAILSVKDGLRNANIELINYGNSIRKINWDAFDMMQERITALADESNFLIKLMDSSELFDDKGQPTGTGNSQIGLHALNYNVYMKQADQYADEIKKLNNEIAKDTYDNNLITRRNELLKLQRDSILAAEDEKQAVRDLVEQGINAELDSLTKLIDAYKESLDGAKDLYDYQKNVKEQTREIASLQKQLTAYSGDNSEENRARVQRLQVDLSDAMDKLQETNYDRYISDQKNILDDMYDEYELILNQRLDNVDLLMSDMIAATNQNAAEIKSTIATECAAVGTTMSESMNNIWSGGPAQAIVSVYGDQIVSQMTSVNDEIANVGEGVMSLYNSTGFISSQIIAAADQTIGAIDGINTGGIDNSINSVGGELKSAIDSASASATQKSAEINTAIGGVAGNINGAKSAIDTASQSATDAAGELKTSIASESQTLTTAINTMKDTLSLQGQGSAKDATVAALDTTMKGVSTDLGAKLTQANNTAKAYGDALNSNMGAINDRLGGIANYLDGLGKNEKNDPKPNPPKPEPPKPEPAKVEPTKAEPAKVEPKAEETKVETPVNDAKKQVKIVNGQWWLYKDAYGKEKTSAIVHSGEVYEYLGEKNHNTMILYKGKKRYFNSKGAKKIGFSKGGYIADLQKVAYQNGDDMVTINTLKKGEAVLTPEQAAQFKIVTQNLSKLNGAIEISKQLVELTKPTALSAMGGGDINVGGITIPISIESVQDYNDFVRQMRDDKTFERMIQTMVIAPMTGRSTLAKKKYYS